MSDLAVKATITANAKQLVGETDQSIQQLDKLKGAAKSVGDASKAAANDHSALGGAISAVGNQAKNSAEHFKLNDFQIRELTYSARHLWEQLGAGTPVTTILTTQVGHLSAAFSSGEQIS